MFGETLGLNTQQRIILDLPTTLADLFEYLSSCDLAVINSLTDTDDDEFAFQISEELEKVSDTLLNFLTVHDIMHLRMVCKSTAQIATP
jgi:hypothetical protein